jgi:cation transport ATPase
LQNHDNSSGNINEILDSMSGKGKKPLDAEFQFGNEPGTGLVFDDSDDDTPENEPVSKVKFDAPKKTEKKKEISVPEKYENNKKYDVPAKTEETPRFFTTYVPRFTEVSETYKMAKEPRKPQVRVEQVTNSATAEFEADIDPTAEIEESQSVREGTGVSNVKRVDPDALESASTVFKFAEPDAEQAPAIQPQQPESEVSEPLESVGEPETLENAEDELDIEEAADYVMPDPIDAPTQIVDYTVSSALAERMALEDAPADIGDAGEEHSEKNKFKEYTAYAQRDFFKDRFIDEIMSVRVRFFATAALSLILLVIECLFVFGVDIPRILNISTISTLPGAMALIDIQFVVCIYLLALPETVIAVKSMAKGRAVPELFVSAAFIVSVLYTVFMTISSPRVYPLFGLLFAVSVLSAIGASYFKKNAEFSAFKLISVNGEKRIIDKKYTRTLESENVALDGVVEEHKSKTARIFRTVFVSGFFKRSGKISENSYNVLFVLGIALASALVTALVAFFIPGGFKSAMTAFMLVFLLAMPAFSIMLHKLPFYHAACEAEVEKSGIIGESSLYDYSGVDVITFEDTEVFGEEDVTLQRIMLYGKSDNLTKASRQMAALFMNVGGPLDWLFSNSLDRKCAPAQSPFVSENGIGGEIEGNQVLAGTMEFMLERGVRVPEDEKGKSENLSNSTKIMYAAENGEVYAKFYIRYSFSEEFSMILPTLEDDGIKCLVYTRDPNITNQLISGFTAGGAKVRILKKTTANKNDSLLYRKICAGMVTSGDKMNAINMILLSKRYVRLQNKLAVTELWATAVGAILAAVLSIGGMSLVPPIALALWQAAWCGVLHFISAKTFRKMKKEKGNRNV